MITDDWFHLFRIGKLRQYLTVDQAKAVIHAYVTSRLDMNNSLLTGMSPASLSELQKMQHAAARLITGAKKAEHIKIKTHPKIATLATSPLEG